MVLVYWCLRNHPCPRYFRSWPVQALFLKIDLSELAIHMLGRLRIIFKITWYWLVLTSLVPRIRSESYDFWASKIVFLVKEYIKESKQDAWCWKGIFGTKDLQQRSRRNSWFSLNGDTCQIFLHYLQNSDEGEVGCN